MDVHVFYCWTGGSTEAAMDRGFARDIQWDVPLLDGYGFTWVPNESEHPGTHHFWGLINPTLNTLIDEWNPDALLVYGWNYRSHLAALRHFHSRMPVLFRGDSTLLDQHPGPKAWLRRAVLTWIYRHVDTAVYVGTNNRAYYEWCGLTPSQLAWAPHSIDNDRFGDAAGVLQREANQWRESLGISPGAPTVLFAGKLELKKAPDLLLEAFLQVGRNDDHLIIAGAGPLEQVLRRRAEGHANVHFIGFQNQSRMPVVYRLADVFALPSRGPGETWGLAVNEAMACARPVIVSDRVGCAPDLVKPGLTGEIVRAGDCDHLAKALGRFLGVTGRREALGSRAFELIRNWRIEIQAERLEIAVEETVARNPHECRRAGVN